jgi:hypothetical protein
MVRLSSAASVCGVLRITPPPVKERSATSFSFSPQNPIPRSHPLPPESPDGSDPGVSFTSPTLRRSRRRSVRLRRQPHCNQSWASHAGLRGRLGGVRRPERHPQPAVPGRTGVRFTHHAPAIAFDATQRSGSSANEEGRGGRGRATAAPWSDTQASFPFEAAGPGCRECPTGEVRRQ